MTGPDRAPESRFTENISPQSPRSSVADVGQKQKDALRTVDQNGGAPKYAQAGYRRQESQCPGDACQGAEPEVNVDVVLFSLGVLLHVLQPGDGDDGGGEEADVGDDHKGQRKDKSQRHKQGRIQVAFPASIA